MSGEVEVELDDIERDLEHRPSDEENTRAAIESRQRYKDRFESILMVPYDDKESWWDHAEDCMKKDGDFGERVSSAHRTHVLANRSSHGYSTGIYVLIDFRRRRPSEIMKIDF